jgi:hypothetical protein
MLDQPVPYWHLPTTPKVPRLWASWIFMVDNSGNSEVCPMIVQTVSWLHKLGSGSHRECGLIRGSQKLVVFRTADGWSISPEYPLQLGGFYLYIWVISGIFLGRYTQQHILWPGSRLHECVPSNHRNPTAHCFTNLGSRENLHTCGVFPCLKIPDPGTIRCWIIVFPIFAISAG